MDNSFVKDGITLNEGERQPCEIWSRVMGYHRPVQDWNKGKQAEFAERLHFSESKINERIKS